ncbi:hypothetical protein [Dokdonia sp. Asnod3-C12]|uniref:hypothetical protein n=1 Tax=Dokdonia sp. Asnod3-C12 TaxID=3160575 RepID=UPI003868D7BF
MKFFLVIISLLLSVSHSFGQTLSATQDYRSNKDKEHDLSTFKGSQYLEDDFKLSIVQDKLTNKETKLYLRYDVYSDTFERKVTPTSSSHTFLEKAYGVEVLYNSRSFTYTNFSDNNNNSIIGYIEYIGNYDSNSYFIKHEKTLRLPEKAPNPQVPDKAGKISDDYYFLISDKTGKKPLDVTKRNIYDLFANEDKDAIKNILKENKLKFKDPLDLKIFLKNLNK